MDETREKAGLCLCLRVLELEELDVSRGLGIIKWLDPAQFYFLGKARKGDTGRLNHSFNVGLRYCCACVTEGYSSCVIFHL